MSGRRDAGRRQLEAVVAATWTELADAHDGRTNLTAVHRATKPKLTLVDRTSLEDRAIWDAIRAVDRRRTKPTDGDQLPLFPDKDLYIVTGAGERVRQATALDADLQASLDIGWENHRAVGASMTRRQRRYDRLRPYTKQGMTWWDAAGAWRRDNPGRAFD